LERSSKPGVGNLSLVASQKQAVQGMTGCNNIPSTIPFPLLFMMLIKLGNLWNFNQINPWFSQFMMKAQKTTHSTFIAQCYLS